MTRTASQQAVDAFEMAARESEKAWHGTSLLSLTLLKNCEAAIAAFSSGSAEAVGALLEDVAGAAFASQAIQSGIDAQKAANLGGIVIRLLARALVPGGGVSDAIEGARTLQKLAGNWIGNGECGESGPDDALQKINQLLDNSPQVRLALLAPFAPALSVILVVLRAHQNGFNFKQAPIMDQHYRRATE